MSGQVNIIQQAQEGITQCIVWQWRRALTFILGPVMWLMTKPFIRMNVVGLEKIPREGKILILAKHPPYLATICEELSLFWPLILEKPDLWPYNVGKIKHLWWWPRRIAKHLRLYMITDNGADRQEIISEQIRVFGLDETALMMLYPTGTRDEVGEAGLKPYRHGIGRLVKEVRPIIVFVWDDSVSLDRQPKVIWWRGVPIGWRRAQITVTISSPIDSADISTNLCERCNCDEGADIAEYLRTLHESWAAAAKLDDTIQVSQVAEADTRRLL